VAKPALSMSEGRPAARVRTAPGRARGYFWAGAVLLAVLAFFAWPIVLYTALLVAGAVALLATGIWLSAVQPDASPSEREPVDPTTHEPD
jgi:endonuclease/exonuclease/phosphatase (EEP) superfamily protein YafD